MRYWHYRRCLRPSRFIWFVVGAVTATFCYDAHERRHHRRDRRLCWHDRASRHTYAMLDTPDAKHRGGRRSSRRSQDPTTGPDETPRLRVLPLPMPTNRAEEERQRIWDSGKQAVETLVDVSETTLECMLTAVRRCKARLAENRARHARELRELQALREESRKRSEEWRRQQEQGS